MGKQGDSSGSRSRNVKSNISNAIRKRSPIRPGSNNNSSSNNNSANSTQPIAPPSAVPSLKVMRLQSPSLSQPGAGLLGGGSLITPTLRLPDSFGVIHIGETFCAYLGAVNTSPDVPVTRLLVRAALQTPSGKFALVSSLDNGTGFAVPPTEYLSTIVSRALEEVGPHVLRVDVQYGADGKVFRKYYRFNVSSPLLIRELTVRTGEARCYVSIAVENVTTNSSLVVSAADFEPPDGLLATKLPATAETSKGPRPTAVQRFDESGYLSPGSMFRYLFMVSADNRAIVAGDELGKAVFSWRKTMGETGRILSTSVLCPPCAIHKDMENSNTATNKNNNTATIDANFVVHGSGLSMDVAASARKLSSSKDKNNTNSNIINSNNASRRPLHELFPVTVEPIDPPTTMKLASPLSLQLLVVNHSPTKPANLQLQMRLPLMSGVVVCGPSFINLGMVPCDGGSVVVGVRLVALLAGLFQCRGCWIVDLDTGLEITMPSLYHVFVEGHNVDDMRNEEQPTKENIEPMTITAE